MLRTASLILLCILVGCGKHAVGVLPSSNQELTVDILGDVDGCRIYRFIDVGSFRYFVRCGNLTTATSRVTCGKNCTKEETIQTQSY